MGTFIIIKLVFSVSSFKLRLDSRLFVAATIPSFAWNLLTNVLLPGVLSTTLILFVGGDNIFLVVGVFRVLATDLLTEGFVASIGDVRGVTD